MKQALFDFYKILEISQNASPTVIEDAYLKLRRKHHPLFHPGDEHAIERFEQISRAYKVLSNPDTRREYDLYLRQSGTLDDLLRNLPELGGDWTPSKADVWRHFVGRNSSIVLYGVPAITLTGGIVTYYLGLDITPFNDILNQNAMEIYPHSRGFACFIGSAVSVGIGSIATLVASFSKTAIDVHKYYKRRHILKDNIVPFGTKRE